MFSNKFGFQSATTTDTRKACLNYQGPDNKGPVGEECGTDDNRDSSNFENFDGNAKSEEKDTYEFFQKTFDRACSTNFKSCQTDSCPAPRLYSGELQAITYSDFILIGG